MTPPSAHKPSRRAAPRSGPSEIAPGVFVGGWKEAEGFQGARFCVLDDAPDDLRDATHIPLLKAGEEGPNRANLDRLAREIRAARRRGEPVVVFCGHGVRRSPLGGAWYLRTEERISLDAAFDRVAAARPKVERPREWLPHADELDRT